MPKLGPRNRRRSVVVRYSRADKSARTNPKSTRYQRQTFARDLNPAPIQFPDWAPLKGA